MAIHHILCIHGIGKHGKDWVREPDDGGRSFADLLAGLWAEYPTTRKRGDFAEKVKLHSIRYDDEIEKIFNSWKDYASDLKKSLDTSPVLHAEAAWFTQAMDEAGKAQAKEDWGYTHLLDLLMFAGSMTLQQRLVAHTARQVMDIVKSRQDGDRFSVIAHSLGTAMAHKVIQALFNEGVDTPQGGIRLEGNFKFENVTMIANTSYSLSRDKNGHYKGKVRPSLKAGEGCCYTWINVNHRLDPVGRFLPFDPDKDPDWLDPMIDGLGWHRDIELKRVSSKHVHSINHYFRDPAFHIPYIELTFDTTLDDDTRTKAMRKFLESTPEGAFKSIEAQLKTIEVSNSESYKDLFAAIAKFREIIRQS